MAHMTCAMFNYFLNRFIKVICFDKKESNTSVVYLWTSSQTRMSLFLMSSCTGTFLLQRYPKARTRYVRNKRFLKSFCTPLLYLVLGSLAFMSSLLMCLLRGINTCYIGSHLTWAYFLGGVFVLTQIVSKCLFSFAAFLNPTKNEHAYIEECSFWPVMTYLHKGYKLYGLYLFKMTSTWLSCW